MWCRTIGAMALGLLLMLRQQSTVDASAPMHHSTHRSLSATTTAIHSERLWGIKTDQKRRRDRILHVDLRGGFTEAEQDEYDEDESEEEGEEYDDSDDASDAEEEEEQMNDETAAGVQMELKVEKFDEPLVPSPMISLGASLGVMLLARRVDLFHPTIVRAARFLFIAYLISLQAFVVYARMKAKSHNDRTPLTMSSPLSAVLNSQLGEQNGMMKNLASSLLSSESTVMEYDLKQAKSMQSGLLFNMMFMWFLHFKMNQVQPLIIQTVTGFANLVYSPLFQVYVLGRNLERPFKNPAIQKAESSKAADGELAADAPSEVDEANEPTADNAISKDKREIAKESDDENDVDSETIESQKVEADDSFDDDSDEGSTDDESDNDE